MKFPDLSKVTASSLKGAFEEDIKKSPTDAGVTIDNHVHHQVSKACGKTKTVGTKVYDEIDLSDLVSKGYYETATFIMTGLQEAGVRPDTPFHNNDEERYPPQGDDWTRYMELNCIGGGMRLIFDATTQALFLSYHYSYPAAITATGGDMGNKLATFINTMQKTHRLLSNHSKGLATRYLGRAADEQVRTARQEELAGYARQSPQFVAWLGNKSAGQTKSVVRDLYNVSI